MRVDVTKRLAADQVVAVGNLADEATRVDRVTPLSERVLLQVRADNQPDPTSAAIGRHLLAYDGPAVVGYAHLTPALAPVDAARAGMDVGPLPVEPPTAELVVAVAARRRGVARGLLTSLSAQTPPDDDPTLQVWAHGNLPAARELASATGFAVGLELRQLLLLLSAEVSEAFPDAELPAGFRHRAFRPGVDEDAWLAVNAQAFARHPEQGRITRHDVELREAEPWFDPAGFLLVEDIRTDPPTLAGFHWTKVHETVDADAQGRVVATGRIGEVYVVGVGPAYQGMGLGRAVTVLGLRHLLERGLRQVMLYVDATNAPALATYARLGFREWHVDALYVRTVRA